ncbi:alpha-ketoglutarate-dependent dioxygenase alkB homolog 7, mitochondrial [Narcine bancroftii]|uniref:alpha-ketoglutarate-dependent dioxygenase alkB homolog 7, mitochondrial n=1 Tax=Narcine bancroftii TaxID=1343680 RepID=UPI003831C69E
MDCSKSYHCLDGLNGWNSQIGGCTVLRMRWTYTAVWVQDGGTDRSDVIPICDLPFPGRVMSPWGLCFRPLGRSKSLRPRGFLLCPHRLHGDAGLRLMLGSSPALLQRLSGDVELRPGFVSPAEEAALMRELEPRLQRQRYQRDHWDQAIHGYREIEKSQWMEQNKAILQRLRDIAFPPGVPQLSMVHVLDLDKTGFIDPHVDSVKFCGDTIAGLCLLSDSVMRLLSEDGMQDRVDLLLQRRSAYILRGAARYQFSHQILREEESFFGGLKVPRDRRISVICRNLPRIRSD